MSKLSNGIATIKEAAELIKLEILNDLCLIKNNVANYSLTLNNSDKYADNQAVKYEDLSTNVYKIRLDHDNETEDTWLYTYLLTSLYSTNQNFTDSVGIDSSHPIDIPTKEGMVFKGYFGSLLGSKKLVISSNGLIIPNVSKFTGQDSLWKSLDQITTLTAKWAEGQNCIIYLNYLSKGGSWYKDTIPVIWNSVPQINNPASQRYGFSFLGYYTLQVEGTQITDENCNIISNVSGYTGLNGEWIKIGETTLWAQYSDNRSFIEYTTSTTHPCLHSIYKDNYKNKPYTDFGDGCKYIDDEYNLRYSDSLHYKCCFYDFPTKIVNAFFKNEQRLTDITIPSQITEIGLETFYGCTGLTSITIPKNVKIIGRDCFSYCDNIKLIYWQAITLNLDETLLNSYGFGDLVESILFGNEVEYIPRGIAYNSKITTITIPESVKIIGISAFRDCINLTKLRIPESVTKIETKAFQGCSNIGEPVSFPGRLSPVYKINYGGTMQGWRNIIKGTYWRGSRMEIVYCEKDQKYLDLFTEEEFNP